MLQAVLAEAQVVDQICGPIMQLFGYGTEPEWQNLLSNETSK